jgi:hypothetical protein
MRFMMIVKASKDSENGVMPTKEQIDEMGEYNQQLIDAGIMLAGEGLHPTSNGFRVRFEEGGRSTVIDGPFTESKDLIAGFWVIKTNTREEAEEWARKVPFQPGDELEVRQIFELEDFPAETVSNKVREQEETWRKEGGYV